MVRPRAAARASRSGTRSTAMTSIAEVLRDARRHVADRAEAEHGHRTAVGDVGVGDGLPGGGQDIRQVDEAGVRRALRAL